MLNVNGRDNLWRFGEEGPTDGDIYVFQETRVLPKARKAVVRMWVITGYTCNSAHGQEEPGIDGRLTQSGGVLMAVRSDLRQRELWFVDGRVQTTAVRV